MDNVGIAGGIVIADSALSSPIGTNEECLDLFGDCKNIFIMAGISPLTHYNEQLDIVKNDLKDKKIVGVKLYPGHELYYMNDRRLKKVFELCEEHDMLVAIHTEWENSEYNDPKFFTQIANDHPELKMVICHMWYPHISYCVKITETNKNIFFDISSLAFEDSNKEMINFELSKIVRKYPDRVIFGSDYGACSMQSHIELANRLDAPEEYKEQIKWISALTIYKIKLWESLKPKYDAKTGIRLL